MAKSMAYLALTQASAASMTAEQSNNQCGMIKQRQFWYQSTAYDGLLQPLPVIMATYVRRVVRRKEGRKRRKRRLAA